MALVRCSRRSGLAGLLAVLVGLGPAAAHVAPSPDQNNRYYKLTPLGDRVRIAYTVYMGEAPGRSARRGIDENGDGILSAAEIERYGDELAAAVHGAVEVTLDGAPADLRWTDTHVGMGTPTVDAGAFSVDVIGWACMPPPTGRVEHDLVFRDQLTLPRPGESGLRIEASPGVSIERASFDPARDEVRDQAFWRGGPGPAGSPGFHLSFVIDAEEAVTSDDEICAPPSGSRNDREPGRWLAIALIVLAALGGTLWAARRR